jgi:hypothetical protein
MNKLLVVPALLLTLFGCQTKSSSPSVNSNPPNNLSLSYDQSQILIAGVCSAPQAVKILDLSGNPTPAVTDQVVHLSSPVSTVNFYADSSCLNPISVVKIKAGSSSSSFYIQDSATGYFSYSATTSNITADSKSHTSVSPNATQITLTGPAAFGAGACSSAFTISTENYAGQISTVTEDTPVTFSNVGLGKFYTSADCSDLGSLTVTIPSGSNSLNVYFKAPKVGGYNITATAPGPVIASTFVQVKPGSPTKMAFATSPQTVVAGSCSGVYTVQYEDAFGNPSSFTSDTPINLSGTGLTFYTDSACATPAVTTITIPSNSTNGSFYISGTSIASNSVTISGVGADQNQSLSISPGLSSKLFLSSFPSAITAGAPFGRVSVQVQDQYGNVVNGFNRLYTLAAYSDSTCKTLASTQLNGVTQVTTSSVASFIGLNYTKASTVYIGATSVGLAQACSSPIVVNSDFASRLTISGPAAVKVGTCSLAYNVSTTDQYNNQSSVTANTTLNLGGGGGGSFYAAADCSGNPITQINLPANTPSINFYFKDLTVEGLIFTAAGVGPATATIPTSVVPGDPAKIAFFAPATMTAGECTSGFSVKILDSYGNNSATISDLIISLSQNGNSQFFTDSTCQNNVLSLSAAKGTSLKQFYVKDSTTENLRVDVQSLSFDFKILTVNPAGASKLSFISAPSSVTAGNVFPAVKVGVQDSSGNLLLNATNSISLTAYSNPGCSVESTTQISGTRTQNAVSSIGTFGDLNYGISTSFYLGASSGSLTKACSPLIQITPANAAQLALVSLSNSTTAGSCISVDVTALDNQGNASSVISDTLVSLSTASQAGLYSTVDCTGSTLTSVQINHNTSSTRIYLKDIKAENVLFTGSNSSFVPGTLSIAVKESTPTKLAVAGPSGIVAGKCSSYSVQALDAYNNLSKLPAAITVNLQSTGSGVFFSDPNCLNQAGTTTIAATSNLSTVFIKDPSLEVINLTATSSSLSPMTLTGVVVSYGAPTKLAINGVSTLTTGACTTYQIQSLDDFSNLANVVTDKTITFQNYSFGQFFTSADCSGSAVSSVTLLNHTNTVIVSFDDTRAEGINFTASEPSLTTASKAVTINPSPAGKIVVNSDPKTVTAGICSSSIDLKLEDSAGNFVNASSPTTINLTDPNIQYYSQSGCGSAPITSTQIASGSAGVSVYAVIKKTSVKSLSMTSAFGSTTQSITVNADITSKIMFSQVPASGVPGSTSFSVPIIIQPTDQFGNDNTIYSGNVTLSSFKDSACLNPTLNPVTGTVQQQFVAGAATYSDIGYSQAETIYFKASSGGLPTTCSSAVVISASSPTKIALSGLSTVTAGVCAGPFNVTAQDGFSNAAKVLSATTVNFTGLGVGGSVHSTAACSDGNSNTAITIAANNSTQSFYLRGVTVGNYTMSGSSTLGTGTLPVSIIANTASVIAVSGPSSIYSGSCNQYVLKSQDAYSNVATVTANKTFPLNGKSSGNFYSDSNCTTAITTLNLLAGTSSQNFYFQDSSVGDSTTLTSALAGFTVTGQAVSVLSKPPAGLAITGLGTLTSGTCSPYAVSLIDSTGTPATSITITPVSLTGASLGSFYQDSSCTVLISSTSIPVGQISKTVYFKDGQSEFVILNATAPSLTNGVLPVTINSGSPTKIVFNVQPQSTTVAGVVLNTISAYYVDQFNNTVFSPNAITLTVLNSSDLSAGPSLIGTASKTPDSTTSYSTYSDLAVQKSGNYVLKASGSTVTGTSNSFTITPAAVSTLVKVSGDNQTGSFNTALALPLVVLAQDQFSNIIPGTSILFSDSVNGGSYTPSTAVLTGADGKASAIYKTGSTAAGTLTLKVVVSTNSAVSVNFSETVNGVKSLAFSANPFYPFPAATSFTLDRNVCHGPFTLKTLDQTGNLIATTLAFNATLTATDPSVGFFSDYNCTTASNSIPFAAGSNYNQFYMKTTGINGFTFNANAPSITGASIPGTVYALRYSTNSLNYGTTNANADQTLTVINDGTAFNIPGFTHAGSGFSNSYFQVVSDGCTGVTLPQGGSCAYTVRFVAGQCGIPNNINASDSIDLVGYFGLSAGVSGNTSYQWVELNTTSIICNGGGGGQQVGACGSHCQTNAWIENNSGSKTIGSCGSYCCNHNQECL